MFNPESSLHCSEFAYVQFSPKLKVSLVSEEREPKKPAKNKTKSTITRMPVEMRGNWRLEKELDKLQAQKKQNVVVGF